MKKLLSLVLVGIMLLSSISVFAANPTYDTVANELKKYNIMNGDPDGNMRLEDTITRAEATALIVRLHKAYGEEVVLENIKFEDLEGHWAYNEIEYAKCANLIDGTSETTFEPERNVTVQEFAKMVISLIGYKEMAEQRGGFPHGYIMTASSLGLFTEITTKTDDSALRGDVAIMLAIALDIPIMQIKKEPEGFNYEDSVAYEILDGKNGMEYVTLRTLLEGNSDVPRFNGPEYTGHILQISELKATKDGYTFKNSLNKEDKATYIINSDTYIYLSENTVELTEIKNEMYAQCWHYTDDKDDIELLKIELMKEKPSGI